MVKLKAQNCNQDAEIVVVDPSSSEIAMEMLPIKILRTEEAIAHRQFARNSQLFKKTVLLGLTYISIFSVPTVNSFVSAYFMKEVSFDSFIAVTLSNAVQNVVTVIFISPSYAGSAIIGHDVKAKKPTEDIARFIQAGWILMAITSIPPMFIFAFSKPLLIELQQSSNIASLAQSYFRAYLPGVTATFLYSNTLQLFNGLNRRFLLVIFDVITVGLSLASTYIFALGKLGCPELGIRGYGYARVITVWISLISSLLFIRFKKEFNIYKVFQLQGNYKKELIKFMKGGLPFMLGSFSEVAIITALSLFAGALGGAQLAAQGIMSQYYSLVFVSTFSFFRTTTFLISCARGENKAYEIKGYMKSALLLSSIMPILLIILASSIPKHLARVFLLDTVITHENETTIDNITQTNDEIYSILKIAFPISAMNSLIDAARMTLLGTLIGLEDTFLPGTVNTAIQLFIMLPLMYALGFHTSLGVSGLQVGYTIGVSLITGFLFYRTFVRLQSSEFNTENDNFTFSNNKDNTFILEINLNKAQDINCQQATLPSTETMNASWKTTNNRSISAYDKSFCSFLWGKAVNFFKNKENKYTFSESELTSADLKTIILHM